MLIALPPEEALTIATILAWILEAPLIIGMVVELGQVIYTLLPFKKVG